MQTLKVDNWQINVYSVSEYNARYGCDVRKHYKGMDVHTVAQALKLDADGDWCATATRIVLGFAHNTWAYVERDGTIVNCAFFEGVQAMLEGETF